MWSFSGLPREGRGEETDGRLVPLQPASATLGWPVVRDRPARPAAECLCRALSLPRGLGGLPGSRGPSCISRLVQLRVSCPVFSWALCFPVTGCCSYAFALCLFPHGRVLSSSLTASSSGGDRVSLPSLGLVPGAELCTHGALPGCAAGELFAAAPTSPGHTASSPSVVLLCGIPVSSTRGALLGALL